jgi:hypothetical protein
LLKKRDGSVFEFSLPCKREADIRFEFSALVDHFSDSENLSNYFILVKNPK